MSIMFDQKEDLRLRMADLEQKLAESEEERFKLEKTCNVLMRAFREEEKMQYKALNQKYEKFLEDCTIRKRRNDIILRSLCRIEDRSRALFAKTERLKLLKDRYISYLNINDYQMRETHSWRSLPFSSQPQKITREVTPKYVQWTTPIATHLKPEYYIREASRDVFGGSSRTSELFSGDLNTSRNLERFNIEEIGRYERRRPNDGGLFNGALNTVTTLREKIQEKINPGYSSYNQDATLKVDERVNTGYGSYNQEATLRVDERVNTGYGSYNQDATLRADERINAGYGSYNSEAVATTLPDEIKSEKLGWKQLKPENDVSEKDERKILVGEKRVIGDESVEKLKKLEEDDFSHGKRDERHDPYEKIEENADGTITKENKSFPRINYNRTEGSKIRTFDEEKEEEGLDNRELEILQPEHEVGSDLGEDSPENLKNLPKGLDGVDYQDETYPESYYEQPVHQNHTSIASDVILEEDETEQDLDEDEEKNFTPGESLQEVEPKESPGPGAVGEPESKTEANKQTEESNKGQDLDEVNSCESESEIKLEEKQSDKSEGVATEKSDKNKNVMKSNLLHLLESDSESFQIEHGDPKSGNEDSDFDFSFHQN